MSNADRSKPGAKSGRRNKKAEARREKSDSTQTETPIEMQTPEQEQLPRGNPAVNDPIEAVVAKAMVAATEADQAGGPSLAEAAAPSPSPVSLHTIANAYRDYTRKSFADFGAFCQQLGGVRSLDKAMEVQTEFVKRAYEYSVAESRKIRELHGKLAQQTFAPFQGLPDKTPESRGKS